MASTQNAFTYPGTARQWYVAVQQRGARGRDFYLCGHIGLDPATRKVPDSVEREIRLMIG